MVDCRPPIEPCHVGECDGLDEVKALLPPGQLWQIDRDSVYTRFIRALGDVKTEWNRRLCQELRESNPCTAVRLLGYWAEFYSFPECVELTQESLCEWIKLVNDPVCPRGSLGFLQRAMDFVLPGMSIRVNNAELFGTQSIPFSKCAGDNALVVSAPPEFFRYERLYEPLIEEYTDAQDGENPCRRYFIPEIDCLRRCVFPIGISIGLQTDPLGPLGQDVYGVPGSAVAVRVPPFTLCEGRCYG